MVGGNLEVWQGWIPQIYMRDVFVQMICGTSRRVRCRRLMRVAFLFEGLLVRAAPFDPVDCMRTVQTHQSKRTIRDLIRLICISSFHSTSDKSFEQKRHAYKSAGSNPATPPSFPRPYSPKPKSAPICALIRANLREPLPDPSSPPNPLSQPSLLPDPTKHEASKHREHEASKYEASIW
jgi:hypothetical protein